MALSRDALLNRTFVELADTLVGSFDVAEFVHVLAQRCIELLDVDAAGLMLADPAGRLHVLGSSSEETRLLELFELQHEEGPCLDAYRSGSAVSADDLTHSLRWPRLRDEALRVGFHSLHAVPMRLRDNVIGALNLFRVRPGSMNEDDQATCQALADVATIGLVQERAVREARYLAEQLQTALNSRVVIEQAKGVLAERSQLGVDAAFERMRQHARSHGELITDVARRVIDQTLALHEP